MKFKYEPLVSIITLTYNHENYIAECIESVLCQTYENWEMIILDDASTDKTPYIVERYAKKNKKIKFIRNEKNKGPLYLDENYNTALKECKGEWIGYLEGDDVLTKKSLEYRIMALNSIDENQRKYISLLHGKAGRIWMDSNIIDIVEYMHFDKRIINNDPIGAALNYFLLGLNFIYPGSVLINEKKLQKIGGFIQYPKEIRLVDFPTWCYLTLEGKFLFLDKILYFWRRHDKSITMNYNIEISKAVIKFIEKFWQENENRIPEKIKNNLRSYLGYHTKLELLKNLIMNCDFNEAKFVYEEIKNMNLSNLMQEHIVFRLKRTITFLALKLKSSFILKLALSIKRKKYDKILGTYQPFFFKNLEF
ncbi:glycosyltransferase family 2 protein [Thermodesulfovibrio sp. 3907-1M]|uniref:Glycosyltransferase family 2 protein n=1 Tax=Thermodesulfovibrio autotrophicus TaxID=3118333 RepID=A0AAU8GWN1_9BACT